MLILILIGTFHSLVILINYSAVTCHWKVSKSSYTLANKFWIYHIKNERPATDEEQNHRVQAQDQDQDQGIQDQTRDEDRIFRNHIPDLRMQCLGNLRSPYTSASNRRLLLAVRNFTTQPSQHKTLCGPAIGIDSIFHLLLVGFDLYYVVACCIFFVIELRCCQWDNKALHTYM